MKKRDHNSNSCHTDSNHKLQATNVDDSNLRSGPHWSCRLVFTRMSGYTHSSYAVLNQAAMRTLIEESKWEIEKLALVSSDLLHLYTSWIPSSEKLYISSPEEMIQNLTAREEKTREERKELDKLFWFICHIARLLMLSCSYIAAFVKTTPRLKYSYEKASLLIIWHCGDVERNPGPGPPTASDISRDFCKKMISLLVIRYWKDKEGRELTQADYKKKPGRWPEDIWYGDPSTCTNKDRNDMLKGLCNACLVQEAAIPNDWLVLIDKYERSKDKHCSKTEKTNYAKDLNSWLRQWRTLEEVDHVFDRLNEESEQDNGCILRQIFERLKQHLPDLNSKILQSRKIATEPVMSQGPSILGQCFNTDLSVDGSVPSEHNTIYADSRKEGINNSISAQNDLIATLNQSSNSTTKPVPDVHENRITANSDLQADSVHDDQGCFEDLLTDNGVSLVEYLTASTEETDPSSSKACKRKNIPHDGLDMTVSLSKRQKSSTELDFSQSTEISIGCHYGPHSTGRVGDVVTPYTTTENEEETYGCMDKKLDDLMDIIQLEIQEDTIRPENIPVSDLDTVIHEDIPGDIKELNSYLFG